ncbi:uncharacterized protein LOC142610480 [Castanea sativa]|uniref:uncharacterized protein LOC142610480 n=1 Tax=Castanea sativa TaxID=21020 RepID=UPI003F652BAD
MKVLGNQIIDRIQSKLQSWKGKLLSRAGKLTLIKSVMQAMPIYAMSVHLLPKETCNRIDKLMRDFWWGDNIERRKIHTVAWEKNCQTRSNGGLGIRKTEIFNKALVAKQFWRVGQNPQSLRSKILKSKYYPKTNHIWDIEQGPRNSSKIWKNIWQAKNSSLGQAKWQVGSGDNIRLQDPLWYRPRHEDSLKHPKIQHGTVKDLMDPTSGNWNRELINTVYNRPEAEAILSTTFSKFGHNDKVIWPFSGRGCLHSCGKSSIVGFQQELNYSRSKSSWMSLVRSVVNTRKTLDYLFISCHFARAVWFRAAQGLRTHLTNTTDLVSWLESQIVNCDIKNYEELEILTEQGAILWTIWKTRNRAIFENQEPDIHQAVHSVQRLKYEWMQATIAQEQRHFTPLEERHYKSFSNCMEWQTLIIIGNINHCGKVNWDGGAFVIKDRLGQSVKKGCFSWYVRNKKTSNLLTIREALYTTWKEGYRKAILLVSSVKLAKEVKTTNTNNKEAEILLEDIRIQKRMFQSLYIKVAPAPIFQEVQQLAKMAT